MSRLYRLKRLSDRLENSLLTAYNENVFSAGSVSVLYPDEKRLKTLIKVIGETGGTISEKVSRHSLYDLASLTKPIATVLSILILIRKGMIDFKTTIGSVFTDEAVSDKLAEKTIIDLLSHKAGLVAHRQFWPGIYPLAADQKVAWLRKKLLLELVAEQPEKHCYSDLGYLLLGFLIEKVTGQSLDSFFHSQIAEPLGVQNTIFYPVNGPEQIAESVVATGRCPWLDTSLQGIVHDDNCRALGGVAGHAGLFGSISAVTRICEELLRLMTGKPSRLGLTPALFDKCRNRIGRSDWTAGFMLPSRYGSSSGRYFSTRSIGHLGFTGTSFWLDPARQLAIIILTNRVLMGENQRPIKKMRPLVHNTVIQTLFGR